MKENTHEREQESEQINSVRRSNLFDIKRTTTINFKGDIKVNAEIRKYNSESLFVILRQFKNGLYLL